MTVEDNINAPSLRRALERLLEDEPKEGGEGYAVLCVGSEDLEYARAALAQHEQPLPENFDRARPTVSTEELQAAHHSAIEAAVPLYPRPDKHKQEGWMREFNRLLAQLEKWLVLEADESTEAGTPNDSTAAAVIEARQALRRFVRGE